MQRLIDDANKLNAEQGRYTNYTIESYSDVVLAIHDVQTQIGITGTTAKEATQTIAGSLAATKSAFKNLVAGLSTPDADISKLIDNFVDSAMIALDNLVPAVERALTGIGKLVEKIVPMAVSTLVKMLPKLIPVAVSAIITIGDALVQNLPLLLDATLQIVLELARGIIENLPQMIPAIVDIILQMVDILTSPDTIVTLVNAALQIILALTDGIVDAIPKLVERIPEIIVNIFNAIVMALPMIFEAGVELIGKLWEGITSVFSSLYEWGKDIMSEIWRGLTSVWQDIKDWFSNAWDSLFGNKTVDVQANITGTATDKGAISGGLSRAGVRIDGSHAGGLDYVPYDGYIAQLHRGEQIVPATDRAKKTVINIYPQKLDESTVDYLFKRFNAEMGAQA